MTETPEEPKKPSVLEHGKKAMEAADKATTVAESANNAFSAIKWTAIAVVTLTVAGLGYGTYKLISAPAKAVGNAAGVVTDSVKTGTGKIKDGGAGVINRLDIPAADPASLNALADSAFNALTTMTITEPSDVKDRLYRRTNFAGHDGRICALTLNFGNGAIPVTLAADNKSYATAKALGSKDDRLIRMILTAGDDDIAIRAEWDTEAKGWTLKWKATTLKKPVSDEVAERRIMDVLKRLRESVDRCELSLQERALTHIFKNGNLSPIS